MNRPRFKSPDKLSRQPDPHFQGELAGREATHPLSVVGVGSFHGDDQAGWQVIDLLSQLPMLEQVSLHKAAVPHDLLDWLDSTTTLHIVDACSQRLPGVHRLDLSHALQPTTTAQHSDPLVACFASLRSQSSHHFDLLSVLQIAAALGTLPPHIRLWTIAIESAERNATLSLAAQQRAAECTRMIYQELMHPHA